jgi:uncharacterized surface protein with fasciclin (FAS1) repeats
MLEHHDMPEQHFRPGSPVWQSSQAGLLASLPVPHTSLIEDILSATLFPFNTFNTALQATGMQYLLEGSRPLTVFAPTDSAFSQLDDSSISNLFKHVIVLKQLIAYHLVPLTLPVANLRYLASTPLLEQSLSVGEEIPEIVLPTLSGHVLTASLSHEILIDNVRVVQADIEADNIVIHLVEKILWPPNLKQTDLIPGTYQINGGSAAS